MRPYQGSVCAASRAPDHISGSHAAVEHLRRKALQHGHIALAFRHLEQHGAVGAHYILGQSRQPGLSGRIGIVIAPRLALVPKRPGTVVINAANRTGYFLPKGDLQDIRRNSDEFCLGQLHFPVRPLVLVFRQRPGGLRPIPDHLGHLAYALMRRSALGHGAHLVGGQPHHQGVRVGIGPMTDYVAGSAGPPFTGAAHHRVPKHLPMRLALEGQALPSLGEIRRIAISAAPEPAIVSQYGVIFRHYAVGRKVLEHGVLDASGALYLRGYLF